MTAVTSVRTPRFARLVATTSGSTVVASLPVFLVGALATDLTTEFAFGAAGLGALIALARAASALAAMPLGILADRIGPRRALRLACTLAAIAGGGIAVLASSWSTTAIWMVFGGCALVLSEPAANSMLLQHVVPQRHGVAFGIKQASLPIASTISGLSVPLIALTIGWRFAFLLAIPLAVLVIAAVPTSDSPAGESHDEPGTSSPRLGHHRTLFLLGAGLGFGTASALVVPAFYVTAAVDAGQRPGTAGLVLAAASITAAAARIAFGAASDRYVHHHLRFCALLLALGSVGLALLATGTPGLMLVGAIIAAAGSWGHQGVFWFALLRAFAHAPGRITGALAPGGLAGGLLGPLVFGVVADNVGFGGAWALASATALAGSVVLLVGRRALVDAIAGGTDERLSRHRQERGPRR